MLFACIYVPDFPVEAIVRASPELRGEAVAVLDGMPPVIAVIAANTLARKAGIEIRMTKLQAESCPGIHLRRRSIAQEEAAQSALLDCAHAFSPRVEDTSRSRSTGQKAESSCGIVILDVAGLERLLGPPAKIAHDLASRVAKMGLTANVAIAGNPDAAMHAARGFSGVTVITPGTEAERLNTLPVHLLEPSPDMLETLERWGIRNFGDVASLPEIALSQRLGQEGLRLQKLAQGRAQRTLVPAEPAIKFEESIELEDAIELLEPLSFLLNRLLQQICERLISRALAANELRLTLELTGHEEQSTEEQKASEGVHQRSFQLPVPMQDSRTFLKLLELDLAAHPPGGPIKKIVIAAEPAPPRFAQSGLFLPRGPAPERLELTLARIRGITGDDRVGSAELLDTHAPGAFRMRPFRPHAKAIHHGDPKTRRKQVSGNRMKSHSSKSAMSEEPRERTALRIFRPPLQTRVQIKHGMPARVFLRGVPHQVTAAAGPWRNSGGWWTDQSWTRDEWDLELRAEQNSPLLVRMYRDLSSAKWYVEGSFD
jgi:protein ImuB